MPITPKTPWISLQIEPWQLVLLGVYLEDRRHKERSTFLQTFLGVLSQSIIEDALRRVYSPVALEHEREQGEAFLKDFYRGIK
jgi:hypothetical protein